MITEKPDLPTNAAQVVRTVFLVPDDFSARAKPLNDLAATLPTELRIISTSFSENLHSVIQTLSIPFQYTYEHMHSLHWQRIHMAERIRARGIEDEAQREPAALSRAKEVMASYLNGEGHDKLVDDVLGRLLSLKDDPASLAAARELTRQGVVLTWSAIEVLARDTFVHLLDLKPRLSDQLLAEPANRKRFAADRIDWATLASYDYNLSSHMGSYLISKADFKNVTAMRDIYGALFPKAVELHKSLADPSLRNLHQKRNLIVHKRGIVDQQYLDSTGDKREIGAPLWVEPSEVEDLLEATLGIGTEIVRQVTAAV